jgi:hypothetical protein
VSWLSYTCLTRVFFSILKDWSLALEEVYVLNRDGESKNYSRYKSNLHNKMLLWHGKQLFLSLLLFYS